MAGQTVASSGRAQIGQFGSDASAAKSNCTAAPNGRFARYRPTAVTTLRDQPPNAWRTSASPVLGPDGGQASNQRVVEHEEPAEIEPPLARSSRPRDVPGGACIYVAARIARLRNR